MHLDGWFLEKLLFPAFDMEKKKHELRSASYELLVTG